MIKSLALSFCYSTMIQSLARKSVGRLSYGRLKFECTPDTATISQIWGYWISVSVTVCWFLTDKVGRLSGSKVCCSATQWTFQNRLHATYGNNISKLRSLALSFYYCMKFQSLAQKSVGRLSNGPLKIECIRDTAKISQNWGHRLSYSVTVCWFLTKKKVPSRAQKFVVRLCNRAFIIDCTPHTATIS